MFNRTIVSVLSLATLASVSFAQSAPPAPSAGEINAMKNTAAKNKDKKPEKVSSLLKKSNATMNEAQDAYLDGDAKKAVKLYRQALQEMTDVELQHPDRAGSAEFAPLRFRKALCETEIDRIMLEEVTANARSVAVTDTTELEKKRAERKLAAKKHNIPDPAQTLSSRKSAQAGGDASAKAAVKTADAKKKDDPKKSETIREKKTAEGEKLKNLAKPLKREEIPGELELAKDMHSIGKFEKTTESLIRILRADPDHKEARFMLALTHVQSGHGEDAVILIEDLVADYPKDTAVLLLAAAAYTAAGQSMTAMDKLDAAIRNEPARPDAYRNMAWLLAGMTPESTENAEAYYRRSVKLGAARDAELEKLLGFN